MGNQRRLGPAGDHARRSAQPCSKPLLVLLWYALTQRTRLYVGMQGLLLLVLRSTWRTACVRLHKMRSVAHARQCRCCFASFVDAHRRQCGSKLPVAAYRWSLPAETCVSNACGLLSSQLCGAMRAGGHGLVLLFQRTTLQYCPGSRASTFRAMLQALFIALVWPSCAWWVTALSGAHRFQTS